MDGPSLTIKSDLKSHLRRSITHVLLHDHRWPETLRKPTYDEAMMIAEITIVTVASFADWVEAKMKLEVEMAALTMPENIIVRKDINEP